MGYCCVPCCKSTQVRGLSFHKFPTSIESKRQWIMAISRLGNPRGCHWSPKGRSTVCSKHFKNSDYSISTTKKILLPNAVPSVFEDLVGRRKLSRTQAPKSQPERNTTEKKEPTEVSCARSEKSSEMYDSQLPEEARKRQETSRIREDAPGSADSNRNQMSKTRKTRSESNVISNEIQKVSPSIIPIAELIPEIIIPITEEVPESTIVQEVEERSNNSTITLKDEPSHTVRECNDQLKASVMDLDISPHSTTIKISRNLQLVLRKLMTTIEDQRAEISKLKRERDVLNQQVYNLKKERRVHNCLLHLTKNK